MLIAARAGERRKAVVGLLEGRGAGRRRFIEETEESKWESKQVYSSYCSLRRREREGGGARRIPVGFRVSNQPQ